MSVLDGVLSAQGRPRAREAGVAIGTMPCGPWNAITDVPGVAVGHVTIVRGEGPLVPGRGPVRTGVTAILPHGGNLFRSRVTGAVHVINGFGKSAGLAQVAELGVIETPVLLTNTLSVGRVWDAVVTYMLRQNPDIGVTVGTVNPVVGECNDGYLNDIQGRHVEESHVLEAIASAAPGAVAEGAVGAGTGMSAFGFKGGIGTASRVLPEAAGRFSVGALVSANFGRREDLLIDGVPVGRELRGWSPDPPALDSGSVMVVLATDAPVSDRQLGRMARRVGHGLARTGSTAGHGSGDFVIAFANETTWPLAPESLTLRRTLLAEDGATMGLLFQATIEATEEAVINALFAAQTVTGRDGHVRHALPLDLVLDVLARNNRLRRRLC